MLELLAPAGNMETLRADIDCGADAVYVGGKQYHMRLLRDEFHFDNDALRLATKTLHSAGKKIYVTVNSLIFEEELDTLRTYLLFLQELGVDALIVQDLGLLKVAAELKLTIPLHSSVQMGANNTETLRGLQNLGVSRAVLSRNVTLSELRSIRSRCHMELEVFVHGDSCISHEGQCRLSGFAAMSGNRGSCLKPCRWSYTLCEEEQPGYFLAQKDLSLLDAIDDLTAAGVTSLKIEGRMRNSAYIGHLVSVYRAAIDHTLPREELRQRLTDHRVRQLCTGGLYRRISLKDVDASGKCEPGFVSQSHCFHTINGSSTTSPRTAESDANLSIPNLAVKVHDLNTLSAAADAGANELTVQIAAFRQHHFEWTSKTLTEAVSIAHHHDAKLRLELPLVMTEKDCKWREVWLRQKIDCNADAFIVHDLGSLNYFSQKGESAIIAGEGFNLTNHEAIATVLAAGAQAATLSTELCPVDLKALIHHQPAEILVQGPLCGIVSDLCLLTDRPCTPGESACINIKPFFTDALKQPYRIMTDDFCRSHIFAPFERAAIAELPLILAAGIKTVTIDATFYNEATTAAITAIYRNVLSAKTNDLQIKDNLTTIISLVKQPIAPLFAKK
jgi:putative protease